MLGYGVAEVAQPRVDVRGRAGFDHRTAEARATEQIAPLELERETRGYALGGVGAVQQVVALARVDQGRRIARAN